MTIDLGFAENTGHMVKIMHAKNERCTGLNSYLKWWGGIVYGKYFC
jgi:hypothetical protein